MQLEEIVPEYHSKNVFVRSLFLKRLKIAIQLARSELNSNNNLKVIDLGCGEGVLLKLLEKEFKDIRTFGIDVKPDVLEIKKFLRAEIKTADIRNSGFSNNFFDIIFCLDVLEHFEDLGKPVREIERILRSNGLLIVSLPTENLFYKLGRLCTKGTTSAKKGPCSSPHFHEAAAIEKFLHHDGFKIIKKKSLPPIPLLTLFNMVSFRKEG